MLETKLLQPAAPLQVERLACFNDMVSKATAGSLPETGTKVPVFNLQNNLQSTPQVASPCCTPGADALPRVSAPPFFQLQKCLRNFLRSTSKQTAFNPIRGAGLHALAANSRLLGDALAQASVSNPMAKARTEDIREPSLNRKPENCEDSKEGLGLGSCSGPLSSWFDSWLINLRERSPFLFCILPAVIAIVLSAIAISTALLFDWIVK